MRRPVLVAAVVAGLALAFTGAVLLLAAPTLGPGPTETTSGTEMFRFDGHESGVWPYLSPQPTFREHSPINVLVRGTMSEVVQALKERSETQWNETRIETDAAEGTYSAQEVNFTGTSLRWGETRGAARYGYVHDGEEGRWVQQSTQLHDGTYFGARNHIRLYASPHPQEDWVAMQVHSEHFDWFTLRHAVDGVQGAQRHLEADFMGAPFVEDVWRTFLGNDGASDADGWATVVELAVVPAFMGTTVPLVSRLWSERLTSVDRRRVRALTRRITPGHAVLAGVIVGLFLGVRVAGVLLELYAPMLTVHTIAALLYPVIAVGLPLGTYVVAHTLERRLDAAVTASLALSAAILIDYAVIGVDVLPIDLVIHRASTVLALGLIAGGAARRASRDRRLNGILVGGLMMWIGLLAATLLGWI